MCKYGKSTCPRCRGYKVLWTKYIEQGKSEIIKCPNCKGVGKIKSDNKENIKVRNRGGNKMKSKSVPYTCAYCRYYNLKKEQCLMARRPVDGGFYLLEGRDGITTSPDSEGCVAWNDVGHIVRGEPRGTWGYESGPKIDKNLQGNSGYSSMVDSDVTLGYSGKPEETNK